ncbi:MAG: toprim domain-containing protein, partial [Niameybacter sp.]
MSDLQTVVRDVKASLSSERVRDKIAQDLNLLESKNKKYVCFMHSDDTSNPNMSYDKERCKFHCFRCGGSYDLFEHYMQFYNLGFVEAVRQIVEDFGLSIILPSPTHPPKKVEVTHFPKPTNKVLEYIKLRGISDMTISYAGVTQDGKNLIFEYRDPYGMHLANKYRPARKLDKGENKNWWQGSANNTLYNMDKVDISKPLVICEGEFDCLSLIEVGHKNAVSVPAGAKSCSWIEANWDWLIQFEEITLWFDNDNAGKEGAQLVANRLDNCTKIVYCSKANDINELLYRFGKSEVIDQLGKAVALDVEGVLTVSCIENFNVYEAEKIRTRIPIIDSSIMGFVMGSLVITTGYNGSGKSTLINQICISESVEQGYKVFVFSGELTPSNFKSWLYQTIANDVDLVERSTAFGLTYYKPKTYAQDKMTEWLDDKLFLY